MHVRELLIPEPQRGEVLIRVAASGVNFIDLYVREGRYGNQAPFTPGQEAAGMIVAVGPQVLDLKVGERVAWCSVLGTTPLHIYKDVFIPNGLYHFTRHQLTYGSPQDKRFTYNFYERFGGYYGGTLNEFRVRVNYRPTAKFSVSAAETWDRFRLPVPNGNFSVVLASLPGNYSFNRFLTFTSLIL
jgi:threonine dehydrogenase-like Zn-dependent dehydrogenase